MKKSMLEKQLREIQELRSQLKQSPIVKESPFKSKGLKIVAMPLKGDVSTKNYKQREKRRAIKVENKLQTTLAGKLQNFKVA